MQSSKASVEGEEAEEPVAEEPEAGPEETADEESSSEAAKKPRRRRRRRPEWRKLAARLRERLRPLGLPVMFYLASRAVTIAGMAIAAVLRGGLDFSETFTRWDSFWYLDAAQRGYADQVPEAAGRARYSNIPFFPLLPALIRAVARATPLSPLKAGLLLTFLLGLAATLLLWLLTRRLCDKEVANRTVALFCFFPGSFVMSMIYAEPLMLTLVLCALLALLSRRWLLSGAASAFATASRPNAFVLVPCCLWAAGAAIRQRREWRALVAPLLAPLGGIAYFGFLWARTGEALAWLRVQREAWDEQFDFGVTTARRFGRVIVEPAADVNSLLAAAGLLFVLVAGVLLVQSRLPVVLHIYTAGIIFLALGSTVLGARPRFVWTAFPLIMAVGQRLKGHGHVFVVGTLAALLGCLTILSVATQGIPQTLEAIP